MPGLGAPTRWQRGMRAVKTGDVGAAKRWLARLREYSSKHADRSRSLPIVVLELEGLILLEKQPKAAVEKLRQGGRHGREDSVWVRAAVSGEALV